MPNSSKPTTGRQWMLLILVVLVAVNLRPFLTAPGPVLSEIVAVHADIEGADGNRLTPDFGQHTGKALGEKHAAALDADEDDFTAFFVALGDFVSDAGQRPLHGGGIQDDVGFRHGFEIVPDLLERDSVSRSRLILSMLF